MITRLSITLLAAAAAIAEAQPEQPLMPERKGYIVVTDTVKADGKTDVSDALQALIAANPNRTLFFPDGVYLQAVQDAFVCDLFDDVRIESCVPATWKGSEYVNLHARDGRTYSGRIGC